MKKFSFTLAFLCLLLVGCSQNVSNYASSYSIVETEHKQYFELHQQEFLTELNATIKDLAPELSVIESGSSRNVYLSQNGETWKILLHIFTEDDLTYADQKEWIGYIHELELSLYSKDENTAKENGQYIRAIIHLFTPGAEEEVEDVLGIYGQPHKDAQITENVTRVTYGNVCYTYTSGDSFVVTPYDEALFNGANETPPSAIRPE